MLAVPFKEGGTVQMQSVQGRGKETYGQRFRISEFLANC